MTDQNAEKGGGRSQPPDEPSSGGGHPPRATVEMPAEKAYFLQRTQVLEELKADLKTWAKQWSVFLVLIVAVVGYFGVSNVIEGTVRRLMDREVTNMERETREASKAAVLAQDSAAKAKAATEEATKQTEIYGSTVGALQERAKEVDAQFLGVKQRLDAESANIRASAAKDVKDITARLARLEKLVEKVAEESRASRQAVETYQKEVAEMKAASQAEGTRFAANAKYQVTVYFNEKTKDLSAKAVEKLTQAGFKASTLDLVQIDKIFPIKSEWKSYIPGVEVRTVNTIAYTANGRLKAEEVRDLLAPLVQRLKLMELPKSDFQVQWDFYLSAKAGLTDAGLIQVYLVERA